MMNVEAASSAPAAVFTAYAHTDVQIPRGLAAQGKYVWITDVNERRARCAHRSYQRHDGRRKAHYEPLRHIAL